MNMKLKIQGKSKSLTKVLIVLFMLFGVRITHIIYPFSDNPLVMSVILMVIILICFALESFSVKTCSSKTKLLLALLMIGVLVGALISSATPKAALLYALNYMCILLSVPLLHLLKKNKWEFVSFIKTITYITFIGYILRFVASYIQHFTGAMIFQGMYAETIAKGDWFRDGFMRINPPCFGIIFIPLVFYLIVNEKKYSKKVLYWVMILFSIFYTYRVFASRAFLLYQISEVVILIMLYKKTNTKKIVAVFLAIIGVAITLQSGILDKILNSFSLSNAEYGYSTYSRLLSIGYFGSMYLDHPLTGIGFLPAEEMRFLNYNASSKYILEGGHLTDIGFLYSIVQLGFPVILFLVLFFWYGFKAGKLQRSIKENNNKDILAWGIIISIGITGISVDLFSAIFLHSAPFCLAIIDWIYYDANRRQKTVVCLEN